MILAADRVLRFSLLSMLAAAAAGAQPEKADPKNDPRVGLKPGFSDAGEAIRNMELVVLVPKPEGFFDPKQPGGEAIPPERDPKEEEKEDKEKKDRKEMSPVEEAKRSSFLNFANSDLAFAGDRLYVLTQNGDTHVFAASPKYELLATNRLGEGTNASHAVADGELYIRTAKTLWCISEKK